METLATIEKLMDENKASVQQVDSAEGLFNVFKAKCEEWTEEQTLALRYFLLNVAYNVEKTVTEVKLRENTLVGTPLSDEGKVEVAFLVTDFVVKMSNALMGDEKKEETN